MVFLEKATKGIHVGILIKIIFQALLIINALIDELLSSKPICYGVQNVNVFFDAKTRILV
jgi:hypothetical protein